MSEKYIEKGNKVVVVGGGYGLTSVVAAKQVGSSGEVTIYEAGSEVSNVLEATLYANNVSLQASVEHAIVGEGLEFKSSIGSAAHTPPSQLPECDVLEMDCEGAEIRIIEKLSCLPEVIIVETHPRYGATTPDVKSALQQRGYRVVDSKEDPLAGHILAAKRNP